MSRSLLFRAVGAQAHIELRLTLRRGESLLVTLFIPAALLLFFASARVLPAAGRSIEYLLPGSLALAVISTGLVSLSIATAYERYYGVLRRFGVTPFPLIGIIAAKVLALLCLEAVQTVVLVSMAAGFFGWRPHGSVWLALGALVLGTSAFAGLGLAIAGAFRAEATLALTNGLFLFFLLLGGLYVPLDHLPSLLVPIARILPAYVLADVLRAALAAGVPVPASSVVILVAWAVAGPLLAGRLFRWE